MLVRYDSSKIREAEIKDVLRKMGYPPRELKGRRIDEYVSEIAREKKRLIATGILVSIAGIIMILMWLGYETPLSMWIMLTLAIMTISIPGGYILEMALQSIRRRILNQHVLLELAAFAGLIGGIIGIINPLFPAIDFLAVAVFVTAYHILSGYTSLIVRVKANKAVDKLLSMQPNIAIRIVDGKEEMVNVDDLQINDIVKVVPGDRIPIDGVIIQGQTSIDESIVTGESLPVDKGVGDNVIGGSLNLTGYILIRVTKTGDDIFIRQVAKYVEEAKVMKPGVIQLVDKILKYYVPGVITVAIAGFLMWTLGMIVIIGQPNILKAGYVVLAALVMGYPCALGMATPLAMIRGGGQAAERGILFRSPDAFNIFKEVKRIILDKTGTITRGKPVVTDIYGFNGYKESKIIFYAASAEKGSEHPVAKAIVEYALKKRLSLSLPTEFHSEHGRGIYAVVDGDRVHIGNIDYLLDKGVIVTPALDLISKLSKEGKTVVAVALNNKVIGVIAISDSIREDAPTAIKEIKSRGIKPVMITGDCRETADYIASKIGIEEVYAESLPWEKAALIRDYQNNGVRVAMVGDGINDAPALTQADVGIAIGTGTDIAIESADIVIISDKLTRIPEAIEISRKTYRKAVQNLSIAFSINGVGVPLSITGLVHPVWAMIAMGLSVSLILINSFLGEILGPPKRTLKYKLELDVPEIHCENCLKRIKTELEETFNDIIVEGDIQTKRLLITYSPKSFSKEEIIKILAGMGFSPKDMGRIYDTEK